jgi:glycosyltransferase involved in cell wall biosynthesis
VTAGLRVGIFTGRQVVRAGDGLVADVGLGRVLNALGPHVAELHLAAVEQPHPTERHSEPIDVRPADLLPLPLMPSFAHGLRQTARCRRVLRQLEERCDVVLVQLAFQAPLALLGPQRPRVYHVFSDVLAMATGSSRYQGPRRWLATAYALFMDRVQAHLVTATDARLVTNGRALLAHYGGRGRAVVSSSLTEADLRSVERARRPPPPARILFVGYLRHEKGLDVLLSAFEQLRRERDCELEIVGPGGPEALGEDIEGQLARLIDEGSVRTIGALPFGPDLFQRYADADVLALPSRSEGTPRVLVEARAFGCPVVATRVGGIPTSVEDDVDGLLVEPDDAGALAGALRRVLDDPTTRDRLVEGGRARAADTTVEAFARVLADELRAAAG